MLKNSLYIPNVERKQLAGFLIFTALLLYIADIFFVYDFLVLSGIVYCLGFMFIFKDMNARNSRIVSALVVVSLPGLLFGDGDSIKFMHDAVIANVAVLSLIFAVSIFGALDFSKKDALNPNNIKGIKGYILTYSGLHFIGSIINYSVILLFGDRLKASNSLSNQQILLLTRSFASAGFWSPFFVTLAFATSYSPGYNYAELLAVGLFMSVTSLVISLSIFMRSSEVYSYRGLDYSIARFKQPLMLSLMIIIGAFIFDEISVISIVVMSAAVYGVYSCFVTKEFSPIEHISSKFPNHSNELGLFLSAGFLNASISNASNALDLSYLNMPITIQVCSTFLLVSLMLTILGIHPIISISIFVGIVNYDSDMANLFAFTLLSTWTIGSSLGHLSGQNIGIATRYV